MKVRIRGIASLAVLVLVVSIIAFGGAPGAMATQGQPVIAGFGNGETGETYITNTNVSYPFGFCGVNPNFGLGVCGATAITAEGTNRGMYATGDNYGIYAESANDGLYGSGGVDGVYGTGSTDGVYGLGTQHGVEGYATGTAPSVSGVFGEANNATGDGVYGQNDGTGFGVVGRGDNGTGVRGLGGTYGVEGEGETGVYGFGNKVNGVFGETGVGTASGVYGQNDATGYGVAGRATSGTGVLGEGTIGVSATGSVTGVRGVSNGAGDGVDGVASNSCCSAVYGQNTGTGNGVAGKSDNGTGVLASSTGGIALKVDGKAQFSRSGKAVVVSGQSSIVVSNVSLTSKSIVLATPQKNVAGVFVQGAVPSVSAHTVTISLNNTVGASYPIGWMVVERP